MPMRRVTIFWLYNMHFIVKRVAMKKVFLLGLIFLFYSCAISAKIYDCFLFYNELELLELRLNELYDHVDFFVLIESRETFRGNLKNYYFEENKHRFEKFLDKIIHVVVEDRIQTNNAWVRDSYQRNQIMRGLVNCQPNDLIIISDADEIIRPSSIPALREKLDNLPANEPYRVIGCNQHMYRYFINRFDNRDFPWPGTIGLYFKELVKYSPDFCRMQLCQSRRIPMLDNAGWHFTYMGGHDRVVTKITSWAHAEHDNPTNKDPKHTDARARSFPLVKIDESYPKYIQDNIDKFLKLGFIDTREQ